MVLELGGNLVDARSYHKYRSIGGLRQKVSHWTIETSCERDALSVLRNERKGAVDVQDFSNITSEQPAPSLRFVDRPEALRSFCNQVDDARNRQSLVHAKK